MANTFLGRHDHVITAVVSLLLAVLAALAVDRAVARTYARRPRALADPALDTRLRFGRRATQAAIVLLGIAIALSQFDSLNRVATSFLASGALAAAIVGFAARQTLANAIAGVMLASTQPLRIGDVVTFEGETGTVEDVRLTATYLLAGSGTRIIIPNERLASGVLHNDTSSGPAVTAAASVWVGHDADTEGSIAAIERTLTGTTVEVAEVTEGGVRLVVSRSGVEPIGRGAAEAELRRGALAALAAARVPRPGAGGAQPPG